MEEYSDDEDIPSKKYEEQPGDTFDSEKKPEGNDVVFISVISCTL